MECSNSSHSAVIYMNTSMNHKKKNQNNQQQQKINWIKNSMASKVLHM